MGPLMNAGRRRLPQLCAACLGVLSLFPSGTPAGVPPPAVAAPVAGAAPLSTGAALSGRLAPSAAGPAWQNWPNYLVGSSRTSANLAERTLAPSNVSRLRVRRSVATDGRITPSPTVVNGTVYVGGGDGCWYALHATTGSVDWRVYVENISNDGQNWASPLLYEGHAYIGVSDGGVVGKTPVPGQLLEVNLTGEHTVRAAFEVVPPGQAGGTIDASPVVDPARNEVVVATSSAMGETQSLTDAVVALNATTMNLTGSWQETAGCYIGLGFGATPLLSPGVNGTPMIAAYNMNGDIVAPDLANATANGSGRPTWKYNVHAESLSLQFSPGAYAGHTLYFSVVDPVLKGTGDAGSLVALDALHGRVIWDRPPNQSPQMGAVTYANGMVFDPENDVLEIRNATNGDLLTSFTPPALSIEDSVTVVDGQVIFGARGYLYDLGLPFRGTAQVGPQGWDAGSLLHFSAIPTGGVPPYSGTWEFGDQINGTGLTAHHACAQAGNYTASLVFADAGGSKVTETLNLSVVPPLKVALSAGPRLAGDPALSVHFESVISGGTLPRSLSWDFGDGSPNASSADPVHAYLTPRSYAVTLTVRDPTGGSWESRTEVVVHGFPALNTSASTLEREAPLTVDFASRVTGGTNASTPIGSWGDGSANTTGTDPAHTFSTAGVFLVTTRVVDALGIVDGATLTVSVATPLSALLIATPLGPSCPAATEGYSFVASPGGGAGPFQYGWSFGDGTLGPGSNRTLEHPYRVSGSIPVTLNISDAFGHTASDPVLLTVPKASCGPGPTSRGPAPSGTPGALGWWLLAGASAGLAAVGLSVAWVRRRRSRPPGDRGPAAVPLPGRPAGKR